MQKQHTPGQSPGEGATPRRQFLTDFAKMAAGAAVAGGAIAATDMTLKANKEKEIAEKIKAHNTRVAGTLALKGKVSTKDWMEDPALVPMPVEGDDGRKYQLVLRKTGLVQDVYRKVTEALTSGGEVEVELMLGQINTDNDNLVGKLRAAQNAELVLKQAKERKDPTTFVNLGDMAGCGVTFKIRKGGTTSEVILQDVVNLESLSRTQVDRPARR